MFSEIILLFLTYFIILFSVLGYGFHFHNIFFKNYSSNSGIIGLIGIFFIIIYSYISHFFISHNLFHNSVFLLLGLFLFIINYKKKIDKTNFLILIFCFLILFLGIIIYKTHDDFPYYHLTYSLNLSENSFIIGTGIFNYGFRTFSSLFYFHSLLS